ncbi:MAG: hypothetical protein A2287_07305 [Candidatus Melainabacteria bacterium RIFOXYA12_FULL_32_12]|nr:MAG: hypothetical protein A2287_07305 [Candidatus Melainabacteria bacterium RIFOXYA12_FULL_32_12]
MFKKIVLVLVCLNLITCLPAFARQEEASSLEIRQMQTRTYEVKNKKELMEAIVNVLQDRGYLLNESNYNLGVISGYNELNNKSYKVRTNFIKKSLDPVGNPSTKKNIKNPEEFYREFFSQLDKSLFIESQGI